MASLSWGQWPLSAPHSHYGQGLASYRQTLFTFGQGMEGLGLWTHRNPFELHLILTLLKASLVWVDTCQPWGGGLVGGVWISRVSVVRFSEVGDVMYSTPVISVIISLERGESKV